MAPFLGTSNSNQTSRESARLRLSEIGVNTRFIGSWPSVPSVFEGSEVAVWCIVHFVFLAQYGKFSLNSGMWRPWMDWFVVLTTRTGATGGACGPWATVALAANTPSATTVAEMRCKRIGANNTETNSQSLLRIGGPVTIMTAPVSQLILAVAVRREPPGAPRCIQKPCCGAGLDFDPPRIPRKSIPLRILVACPLPCKSPSLE